MKGRNKRDNKTKYLLILLLLIAVGYAAIATTLKINGSSTIKSAKWDVYWENPHVIDGSVTNTAPTLSESDTKATFDVTLNEPGDYYEFTIDAVNNGSLDAKIDTNGIVKQVKNSSGQVVTPTILKYEVTNNDQEHTAIQEGHILAKKSGNTPTKETYRVRVEYRNDEGINPSDLDDSNDLVFTIEFSVKYVQGPKAEPVAKPTLEETCPGCVFGSGLGETLPGMEVPEDVSNDISSLGNYFLGYTFDESNIITGIYSCVKTADSEFCLQGLINEHDEINKTIYTNNTKILASVFDNCSIDSTDFLFQTPNLTCSNSSIRAATADDGLTAIGSSDGNITCYTSSTSGAYCSS